MHIHIITFKAFKSLLNILGSNKHIISIMQIKHIVQLKIIANLIGIFTEFAVRCYLFILWMEVIGMEI